MRASIKSGLIAVLLASGAAILYGMNSLQKTPTSNARSDADVLQLLDRFADAWNRHDLDALMALFADDCVFESSGGDKVNGQTYAGRDEVLGAFARVFESMPDAHWGGGRHYVVGPGYGVSEWTLTGTLLDGRRLEVNGCDFLTMTEAGITRKNSYRKQRPPIDAREPSPNR